jgi:hypothetical protein
MLMENSYYYLDNVRFVIASGAKQSPISWGLLRRKKRASQ